MREILAAKEKYGQLVQLVKDSGWLGVDYALEIGGSIKKQSTDLTYISKEFEQY